MGIEGHQFHLPKFCDQVLATFNDLGDTPERPIEIVECVADGALKAALVEWAKAQDRTAVVHAPTSGVPSKYVPPPPELSSEAAKHAYAYCRWYVEGILGLKDLMGSAPALPLSSKWTPRDS